MKALVGPDCPGLSATTIVRLKAVWEEEFQEWSKRSLQSKQYVYVWADGVHFNIRLEEDRQCILVLMGATADGKKELIAVVDGFRESEQSWKGLLLDVKACALAISDRLPDDGLPVDAIGIEEVEAFERHAGARRSPPRNDLY